MSVEILAHMIGHTFTKIGGGTKGDGQMLFSNDSGETVRFYHEQDCCDSVSIEDVCGDIADLLGSPILRAEEVSSDDAEAPENADSYTWTFYKFDTIKGSVTVRWLGESNGYYGESVQVAFSGFPK